jgi:hypothetical protein
MTHVALGRHGKLLGLLVLLAVLVTISWGVFVDGADHRDSPLSSEDPTADINDVFVFVSPRDATKVVFAMTVNGFAVPAVRSSYSFGTDVLYQFKIDNTGDVLEDRVIQVTFDGHESLRDVRCPAPGGGQFVTVVGPAQPTRTGALNDLLPAGPQVAGCTNTVLSAGGIRVWAGLADDPFVVDIGQVNRILGGAQEVFRETTSPALGPLRGRSVRGNGTSGVDGFGGFNASVVVVEVPIAMIQGVAPRGPTYLRNNTTVGVWGTTSRPQSRTLSPSGETQNLAPYIQGQRMGHQLFKTIFLPTAVKDRFNRLAPEHDLSRFGQYVPDALTTRDNDGSGNTIAGRAALLDTIGVTDMPEGAPLLLPPTFGNTRRDLLRQVLLPDVLRINLALPATDVGVATNGLQNGRRFGDDVVDILLLLARQLADVKFPDLSGLPGSGPVGTRRTLDCSVLPACPDRRVLAVLQGTDFIKTDAVLETLNLSISGNDRPFRATFPFIGMPHPLPGSTTPAPGTVGFPPQR